MKLTNLNFTIFVLICVCLVILIGWIINKTNNIKEPKATLIRRVFLFIAIIFMFFANWYKNHHLG